uniref:Uncharacterized protein n=1 Tax=Anguilla anguilla TaxID=7936 RepID=A0A0E9XTA7_ANGAN
MQMHLLQVGCTYFLSCIPAFQKVTKMVNIYLI